MYRNVLVGVDGNAGGQDAVSFARQIVEPGGKVTLATVHPGYAMVGRGSNPVFESAVRDQALELLADEREQAGIETEVCALGSPSVGEGLHRLAERHGADLLVVGSTRRGLIGRVLIGDDTWAALDGAPCAVAIAPAGYAHEPKKMHEVGVAFNGTPESRHALDVARSLAAEHHARVSAFQAISVPTYAYAGAAFAGLPPMEDVVESARASLGELGDVEPHAAYGIPVEELALFSASVDLLVVGSRGYGPFGRLVHGSITRQLTRIARCPLLLVMRPDRDAGVNVGTVADAEAHEASTAVSTKTVVLV